jgi:trypsin
LGKRQRIIGGTDVKIENYAFSVSIRNFTSNRHFCGGSIITERHIITAAHCIFEIDYQDVVIYMGTSFSWDKSVHAYRVETIDIHPNFTGNRQPSEGTNHDLAIIKVIIKD